MAHTYRCANSLSTPKERCKCACDKKLHGIPHSERASALFGTSHNSNIKETRDYSKYKVKELKRELNNENTKEDGAKLTDLTTTIIVDTLLSEKDQGGLTTLRDTLGEITITLFIESITEEIEERKNKLKKEQLQELNKILQHGHFFCTLCCEILKLIKKIEDKVCELFEAAVKKFLNLTYPNLDHTIEQLIIAAAKNIANKMISTFEKVSNIDNYKEATRLLALICCPNILEHKDVLIHSLAPLIKKLGVEKFNSLLEQHFPTSHKQQILIVIKERESEGGASITSTVDPAETNDIVDTTQSSDTWRSQTTDPESLTDTNTFRSPCEDLAIQDSHGSAETN